MKIVLSVLLLSIASINVAYAGGNSTKESLEELVTGNDQAWNVAKALGNIDDYIGDPSQDDLDYYYGTACRIITHVNKDVSGSFCREKFNTAGNWRIARLMFSEEGHKSLTKEIEDKTASVTKYLLAEGVTMDDAMRVVEVYPFGTKICDSKFGSDAHAHDKCVKFTGLAFWKDVLLARDIIRGY